MTCPERQLMTIAEFMQKNSAGLARLNIEWAVEEVEDFRKGAEEGSKLTAVRLKNGDFVSVNMIGLLPQETWEGALWSGVESLAVGVIREAAKSAS